MPQLLPQRNKVFLLLLLILSIFLISSMSMASDFRRLETGQSIPHFSVSDFEDKTYTFDDFKGYDTLLVFWNIPQTEMHRDYSL